MNNWSNDECLSFLEHYQVESCIWNPKDANHKDKKKLADAWNRLAHLTGKSVKDLKNKKEILMTTFRRHLKKKQESMRSGAGADEIYNPTWYAYEIMESFLLQVYTCNEGINTETQSQIEETDQIEDEDPLIRDRTDMVNTPSRPPSTSPNSPTRAPSIQAITKRRRLASETAEKQMAVAFGQLTNVLSQKQKENRPVKEDDCDLYAKLLAIKLRELPTDERNIMMYNIDGLFINRISQKSNERQTPYHYYSRPSSSYYSRHTPSPQVIQSRPTSVNSVYSEPTHNNQSFFPSPYPETSHSAPNITEHNIPTPIPPPPSTYSTSTAPLSSIRIISDQILNPPPCDTNIINLALLQAFENFESSK